MSADLAYLGLARAAELIRAKKLSSVEYVAALLVRSAKDLFQYGDDNV
jgi:hypothetical protein